MSATPNRYYDFREYFACFNTWAHYGTGYSITELHFIHKSRQYFMSTNNWHYRSPTFGCSVAFNWDELAEDLRALYE